MANIKLLRLINGDEILCDVVSYTGDGMPQYTIRNPVRVIIMPSKADPKTPTVGFAPWAEFSEDKTFQVDRSNVVVIMTPVKEFINQYNSIFGGIIAPVNKLVLP